MEVKQMALEPISSMMTMQAQQVAPTVKPAPVTTEKADSSASETTQAAENVDPSLKVVENSKNKAEAQNQNGGEESKSSQNDIDQIRKAVEKMKIPVDGQFHCAKNDAYYTAKVFQKISHRKLSDMCSIDCYHYPTCEEEEITVQHNNYVEYISRTFPDKITAMEDSKVSSMNCYKCGRKLKPKIKWFSNNSYQVCVGRCWTHGLQCGKIKFKPAKYDEIFVIKRIEKIGKKDFEKIKVRQKQLQLRRLEKRHQKQQNAS